VAWGPKRLDVFALGAGGTLQQLWWNGTKWSDWQPLGGPLTGLGNPVSWAARRLDVFGLKAGGLVTRRRFG
jgi:hypothetical protein